MCVRTDTLRTYAYTASTANRPEHGARIDRRLIAPLKPFKSRLHNAAVVGDATRG